MMGIHFLNKNVTFYILQRPGYKTRLNITQNIEKHEGNSLVSTLILTQSLFIWNENENLQQNVDLQDLKFYFQYFH